MSSQRSFIWVDVSDMLGVIAVVGNCVLVHVTTIIVPTQVGALGLKSPSSVPSPLSRCLTLKLINVSLVFYATIHVLNVKHM